MIFLTWLKPPVSSVTLQTVVPNGDVTTTGWTTNTGGTTNLYAAVDETVLDTADYVTATFA